ncbi:MAG: uracil phosphoribosyltransferase, partial [Bacteroidota bacterium]
MINNIGQQFSVINQYIAEIRDHNVQRDSLRFRKNMERLGGLFAYEISKTLEYDAREIITQLGSVKTPVLKEQPVLVTLLRAGLPFHQGFLNMFDSARNAFISVSRMYDGDGEFEVKMGYLSAPNIQDKTIIIIDPLLATGSSMVVSYKSLLNKGTPKKIHVASVIATKEGITNLKKHMPQQKLKIWVGAIDDELTVKSFIVPGLGDAGDLSFG